MKALLKFELRKLIRNKAFYICLGICLLLMIINAITAKVLADVMKQAMEEIGQNYEPSENALTLMKTVFNNNTPLILGVVVSLVVCEDFAGDIIKNIYSKGYSRNQVYFAKLISSLIAFLAILLIGMIVLFLTGLILFGKIGTPGKNYALSVICIVLVALSYFAIYFSLGMIFKKIAPSIVLSILGPTIIMLLFAMVDAFIKTDKIVVSDYWISGLVTDLSYVDVENKTIIASFIVPFIVIGVFITLSFILNNKKDAK